MTVPVSKAFVDDLEAAAQTVYSENINVGPERRREAEHKLLSFRLSQPPFNTCKFVLENSSSEAVQFQAATALKDAVIREWSNMDPEMKESLQQFLLGYISSHEMPHFIREILAQVVAVLVKLKTVYAKDCSHRQSLYANLFSFISSSIQRQQVVGCSVLSALLLEFSLTNKSSSVGLTWDQHAKCKRAFETSDLKTIFDLVLNVLKNIASLDDGALVFSEDNGLCKLFLTIAEQVLTWSFTPALLTRRSVIIQALDEQILFKPGADWRDVLLNATNLQVFFNMCKKCRKNQNLSRLSNSCLAQLATLQGAVLDTQEKECHFLKFFVENLFGSHGNSHLFRDEVVGASTICRNIIEAHKLETWGHNYDMQNAFQKFLHFLTELTCLLMARAIQEEVMDPADCLYMESFDGLLDAWTTIVVSITGPNNFVIPGAMKVFEAFLSFHIFIPEGKRPITDDSDLDIDEMEEDDRDRFCGQLLSVSCLGRTSPCAAMTLVAVFLEKRVDLLHETLTSRASAQPGSGMSLLNLYEDIHWLLLVACHLLADEPDGETVMIPSEIVQCSMDMRHQINGSLSVQLLQSPHQSAAGVSASLEHVDPVVRVLRPVLRLCHLYSSVVGSTAFEDLSPQLVRDTLWFLRIWSSSYLMFSEEFFEEISPVMCSAFGEDSDCGRWTVGYITWAACGLFAVWTSEKTLLEDAAKLLLTLVENEKRCSVVSSCPEFWKLGQELCSVASEYVCLPPIVRQEMMSSLVLCGTSNMNMYREKYWEQTLNVIKVRYHAITASEAFRNNPLDATVQEMMLFILDLLRGIAEAATSENSPLLFNFLSEFLADGSKIMHAYRGSQVVVVSVLELFVQVAHKQICYLHNNKCKLLHQWALSLLGTFSKISSGLRSRDAEEETYQDLSLIIELLTNLLNKDFIDFSDSDTDLHVEITINPEEEGVSAADVVFYGLGIILPHMNTDLLSYPSLCCQYFKLVTFLCEIYPDKVEQLPQNVFNAFVGSLQLGLSSYGEDNCKLSLEALQSLADRCFENPSEVLYTSLHPFTKTVFEVILMHATDMELLRTAGDTFFSILQIDPRRIMELLSFVAEGHQDPMTKPKLVHEFSKLCPSEGAAWKPDRAEKSKFIKVLEEVVFNVRGMLCIK